MKIAAIKEATGPFVKKVVDPALLTFDEYYDMLNKQRIHHPSSAYNVGMDEMREWSYSRIDNFPILLNTITVNGQSFQVRMQKDDRWNPEYKYTKTDEDGMVVRDENGMALYLSPDEVQKKIPESQRYEHRFGIYNQDKEPVGLAQDEWGTWLIMVAREYRSLGFGKLLMKLAWTYEPTKTSGGFTNKGYNTFESMYREFVREYLQSGMYSWLVRSGQITKERAKAIIDSARLKAPARGEGFYDF